jgi:hypothetical protein
MKNRYLLIILLALLVFAYVWQEYLPRKQEVKYYLQTRAFELQDFKKITLPNFSLVPDDKKVRVLNYIFPTDEKKIMQFMENLQNIALLEKISVDAKDPKNLLEYLGDSPTEIQIEKEGEQITYQIGSKPALTGYFYILKKKYYSTELYLAKDETDIVQAYRRPEELELKKFSKFYRLINEKPLYFVKSNIFNSSFLKDIMNLEIRNSRNRYFQINVFSKTTVPTIIDGLRYNTRFFHQYLKELQTLEMKNIFEAKDKLKEEIASIKIDERRKIQLFKKHAGNEGYFVSYSNSPFVYEIDKYQSDLFFANVQSFWTKRLPFLSTVKELDQFEFNLAFFEGDKVKKYPLKVLNQDYFKIIVSDRPHFKTEENKLMQILKMLLGIGEFAQAKHALEYDTQFVNDMEAYREFRVEVNGRKLDFYVKNLEIYLANLTGALRACLFKYC